MESMVGVGLAVLGIGMPATVAILRLVPARNGSNGDMRRIFDKLERLNTTVARMDERTEQQAKEVAHLTERLDAFIDSAK